MYILIITYMLKVSALCSTDTQIVHLKKNQIDIKRHFFQQIERRGKES